MNVVAFCFTEMSKCCYFSFMLDVRLVSNEDELWQIHQLNQKNLKPKIDPDERAAEGFVSWLYPFGLLKQMHQLAPSVIVKDNDKVVAYALATLRESSGFHHDLKLMFKNLQPVHYKGRPLSSCNFYCMGQICVEKQHRGRGLVNLLYQKHKEVYGSRFDFILTEISPANPRSMKAHENIGFKTIYNYTDATDEWNVVIWDWR